MMSRTQITEIIKSLNDSLKHGNFYNTAEKILENEDYDENEIGIVLDTFAMQKRLELEETFFERCKESLDLEPVFRKAYVLEAFEEIMKLPEHIFVTGHSLRKIALSESGVNI